MNDQFQSMKEELKITKQKLENFTNQDVVRIKISKNSFRLSEKIYFTFWTNGVKVENNAWVGIVPASISHGSESFNDSNLKSYKYLHGKTTATFDLPNPGRGSWTVRLHDTDYGGKELAYAHFIVT